jgi:tetratricopeptide (TPR) repeat protein
MTDMTTDLEGRERGGSQAAGRERWRWKNWRVAAVAIVLPAVIALVFWQNSLRPENCYRRGRRAVLTGDRATVIRETRRLLAAPGFESRGRLLAGLWHAHNGRAPEALQDLQIAAQDDSIAVEALTAGAECYYNLGRFVEAVELSQRAIVHDENSLDAHRWLAVALYDLGVTYQAAAELEVVAAKAPHDPLPDRLLGLIFNENEQYAEAIEHYRRSLDRGLRDPERRKVALELVQVLIREKRIDEALEVLGEAERSAMALSLQAECLQLKGRLVESHNLYREAAELDPQNLEAKLKFGSSLLQQRTTREAVTVLREAVLLAPHSAQAHFLLSQAYAKTGDSENSADQLRLFRKAQADEREFSDLHQTAAQDPTDAEARYRLGILARGRGRPELARMWFRAVLAIQPEHAAARAALAEIEAAGRQ